MTDTIILESQNFSLSLAFQVFESDISYPSNTILYITVSSAGFCASTTMDVDIKDISAFCNDLQKIYDSLEGEALIQEPFEDRKYILFSGDKKGHIFVSGVLNSYDDDGFRQELQFENCIDQTFLPHFLQKLIKFLNL